MEAALLGLLLGGIFYKNGDDQSLSGLKTRLSLLYPDLTHALHPAVSSFWNNIDQFYIYSDSDTILCYSGVLHLQM